MTEEISLTMQEEMHFANTMVCQCARKKKSSFILFDCDIEL